MKKIFALLLATILFITGCGTQKTINRADYEKYEGEVTGAVVLSVINDQNLVYVHVDTGETYTSYSKGKIVSQSVFKKNEFDHYINPADVYIGTIDEDSKGRVIGLSFEIKEILRQHEN